MGNCDVKQDLYRTMLHLPTSIAWCLRISTLPLTYIRNTAKQNLNPRYSHSILLILRQQISNLQLLTAGLAPTLWALHPPPEMDGVIGQGLDRQCSSGMVYVTLRCFAVMINCPTWLLDLDSAMIRESEPQELSAAVWLTTAAMTQGGMSITHALGALPEEVLAVKL